MENNNPFLTKDRDLIRAETRALNYNREDYITLEELMQSWGITQEDIDQYVKENDKNKSKVIEFKKGLYNEKQKF